MYFFKNERAKGGKNMGNILKGIGMVVAGALIYVTAYISNDKTIKEWKNK